jgi:hypothetical protein
VRRPLTLLLCSLLLAVVAAPAAFACDTCYGGDRGQGLMIDGARVGVALLLAITVAVQGAFLAFFVHLRRQARRAQSEEIDAEWSRLQSELAAGRRTLEHP